MRSGPRFSTATAAARLSGCARLARSPIAMVTAAADWSARRMVTIAASYTTREDATTSWMHGCAENGRAGTPETAAIRLSLDRSSEGSPSGSDMRHKTYLFRAGILAPLAIIWLPACGVVVTVAGPGVYSGHGISFDYPPGWRLGAPAVSVGCGQGQCLWSVSVVLDRINAVNVTASRLGVDVTAQNLPVLTPAVTQHARGNFRHLGGRLLAGPQAITVGGMPGLRFQGAAKVGGIASQVTVVVAFNGMTAYAFSCTWTPAKARAVQQACAQVLRTFTVRRPSIAVSSSPTARS